MKRFFLAVLFCAVAAASLFAGGKDERSGAAAAGKAVEVVFWHSTSGATGEALENIIKGYNEGPGKEKNIHVNLVYQGYEGTDKVILAYQTRDMANAPDINQGLTSTIPSVMDMSWSVSAERFLNSRDSTITKNTFYTALQRSCTYEGEMAAIPFANSIPLLYYNVEMLREAGYSKPPETMDQLTDYVKKLTVKQGNSVSRYGLNMQTKRYQLVEFCVSQNPASFFGDNEGGRSAPMTRITAGEDGSLRAFLEKLQKLLDTGGYKYVEDSINEEFAQGLSAMVIMSSSRIGTMDRLMPGGYMTAFLPKVNPGDSSGAAVGGSCLNLFDRGSDDRLKAAWDVIQWCASPENQYALSIASGYIPVNTACETMPEMQAYYRENPQYKVALDQMKASNPLAQEPLDLTYNEINGIVTDVMLEFCQGKLDVNAAVAKIVADCNASLNEYHAAND
ncbi:MAG: extracellular solute-binding protein [Treponema sp.]|jgi:sn-glycerol 3-phosphate transport system substrate-binding protein|nr:extracellular solute-binding protein [Treponema sp.]